MATSAVSEAMQLPQNVVDPHASMSLCCKSEFALGWPALQIRARLVLLADPFFSHAYSGPPLDVDSWKNFFLTAGFGETAASFYVDLFQKHEVDLDMLSDVTHEVLAQMGVWKAGHRIRILRMKRFLFNFEGGKRSSAGCPFGSFASSFCE
jgi:hypothetical protein